MVLLSLAMAVTAASLLLSVVAWEWMVAWTREDRLFEWSQVAVLIAIVVLLVGAGWRRTRGPHRQKWLGVALLLGALAFFFAAGEEISWGQRILGLQTPEQLAEINTQEELSLHNVQGVKGTIETWMGRGIALFALVGTVALMARRPRVQALWLPSAAVVLALVLTVGFRNYEQPYKSAIAVHVCGVAVAAVFAWRREWVWLGAALGVVVLSGLATAASVTFITPTDTHVLNETRELLELTAGLIYAVELHADRARPTATPQ
ncbi:MAG: hypothetical protein ACOC9P_02500 [bacterium]